MPLNRITADSITDGTVIASDIADNTITAAKLVSGLLPTAIANSAASYANSAFVSANSAGSYANSAFNTANTDVTGITITSGVYGNANTIASLTLEANGRVSAVTTAALVTTSDPLPNILMLSGM
jgi:hypothetical protein